MRLLRGGVLILLALSMFAGCGTGNGAASEAAETATEDVVQGIPVENAFYYTHVDGHKKEEEMVAFVLFEYEQLKTVRYQVAYIACTCRGPEVNYWSVANVELNKSDGSIAHISYTDDSTGHYLAGLYGDSVESWDGTPVKELFAQFIDENIRGKSQEEINGYVPMHGNVDTYTGATVTPNNAMRMLQGLFAYHNERYAG